MFWGKKIINSEFSDPIYLWKLHVTTLNYIKPDVFFKMLLKDSLLKGKRKFQKLLQNHKEQHILSIYATSIMWRYLPQGKYKDHSLQNF